MGWGDLGVFYQNSRNFEVNRNQPAFATPHLDTMAAEGMQLRRHYCPAPVCAPSRASLMLGVHQGHANVRDNQFDKALENNHTLASVMRQAGYVTAGFGKWGLQGAGAPPEAHPMYRGFDYFFGYMAHIDGHKHYPKEDGVTVWDGLSTGISGNLDKCYTADLWTARAKKWIVDHEANNAAQPFFIYLAYDTPHARLEVPPTAYPPGSGTNGGVQWTGTPGAMINTAVGSVDTWIHPDYTNATWDADNNPVTAEVAWPDYAKRHATMMRRLDDAIADLIQTLKDLNCDTNTLVVFTSDNGPHNESGSGGSYTYNPTFFDSFGPMDGIKRDTWEGGMREPTLVRWPGRIPAGTTNHSPSQFHDWMPTLAQLAGVAAPARSDGVSLVPTLTGVGTQRESTVYVEYNFAGNTPNYAEFEVSRRGATRNQEQVIYVDGYKGIRYNIASAADDFQIYDTLNNPKETTDLAATSAYFVGLQQRMKDRVLQVRRPGGGVTRPYDSALVPPATVASVVTGLEFRAFEDSFPWVPDFAPLTSVTNGDCSGVDLSVRTRNDNIGLQFTGYLAVPSDGTYTIYLTADSRAFLRLHDASVIDADFNYIGGTEISASINLKAGRHPLRLGYVRGAGGSPSLSLQWSGPGIAKQTIPVANLVRAGTFSIPPAALNDSAATAQNTAVTINVLANDSLGSGSGPLRVTSVGSPLAGTAVTNLSGQLLYTPNASFLGEDTFSYTVTDGDGSATATVRVKVFFADGLIWFPFNQLSGLTTEDAGGAFTASLTGFTNDPAEWVAGRWNHALNFNGASNYVAISNFNGILGASNRTCAAWVKTTSTAAMPVIAWGPNSNGNKWTFLLQNGHARIEATSGYLEGTRTVNDGYWHHVAVTFTNDGTPDIIESKLYIDGTVETSFTASLARTVNTAASGNVTIGADIPSAQNRYFAGVIDEPQIYNRALSATEIAALYAASNQSAAAWHRRYYGAASLNWSGLDSAGYPRLLDYALGAQPWTGLPSQRSLQWMLLTNLFQVSFPRRVSGTSELNYQLQSSSDLIGWAAWNSVELAPLPLEAADMESATFQSVGPVTNTAFIRLRVMLP